jgi:hypothetical protein
MPATVDELALRRLLDAGRALVSELDVEAVLDRVLATAADVTGARFAALGVLDARRSELERFLTHGIPEAAHRAIGELPRGRGLLGAVIADPRPLRSDVIRDDPRSYGFPEGHPPRCSPNGRRSRSTTRGCIRAANCAAQSSSARCTGSKRRPRSLARSAARPTSGGSWS